MSDESAELAISEMRRESLIALTEIRGQLALLLQRTDQGDARAAEHAIRMERLDQRLDDVERHQVTRADLAGRTRLLLAVLTIIIALASVVVTVVLALTRSPA